MNILIQDLKPQVGSVFVVHTHAGLVQLRLVEAVERPRRGLPEQFRTPVSLVFMGPIEVQLSQDSYYIDHPVLGRVQWPLVPIAPQSVPNPGMYPVYETILA